MATRALLAELLAAYGQGGAGSVHIEAAGGVEVVRRIESGEKFDLVVLASDAIASLIAAGLLLDGSQFDLVHSSVAVCVKAGASRPAIGTEGHLRRSVCAAQSIGYSTGPSGVALIALFERWGLAAELMPRCVQAPAGVPVGVLVARGEVEIGFQQLSELIHVAGIDVLGTLPASVQITTTFSAGLGIESPHGAVVRSLLSFLNSPDAIAIKQRHGLEPV